MAPPKQTLYDILGVSRDATSIDIGLAYRKAIAAADRATPPDATRQALIQQAHEILSNAQRREAYDASLVTSAEREAAREHAAAPDLDLAAEEDLASPPARKLPWVPIGAAVAVIAVGAFLTFRSTPVPAPKVAEAPTPVVPAPAPAKPRSPVEIMAEALPSIGRVLTYDMSGRVTTAGLALAIEPAVMVTTCEGVVAGSQLVVKVGAETHSATLAITDEALGLCRLLVAGAAFKPLAIADGEPRAGQAVHIIGANDKGDLALTQAMVKAVRVTPSGPSLELSIPIAPAGSGGAVFDEFGKVVGIATRRDGSTSAAVPAAALASLRSRAR